MGRISSGDYAEVSSFLESISFQSLELKFLERFDGQSRTWNFQRHAHTFFEFIYFIEGRAHIQAGSMALEASLSELVIYPPNVPHEEHLENEIKQEIFCFWVDVGPCAPFDRGITLDDPSGAIRQVIEMIYMQYISPRALTEELIAIDIQALFLLIRQYFTESQHERISLIERSLRYIHEHYVEEFTIEDMSKAVYVSPSYLFRIFKMKMHTTPNLYRTLLRIEKAKILLCEGETGLESIAQEIGFKDVKYFSRLFKKSTGLTPGHFRKQQST
jgi:AraC-like DNA-binding protein/mannose-6-phosphate isomerase-like protein (cupin superfamily)